jgi:hypothetical protein
MPLELATVLDDVANERARVTPFRPGGLLMRLYFNDADPVAECECGNRSPGDSINDAVSAWAKHVVKTPDCREKL